MQMPNTDNADPITVLAVTALCARSWVPEARILGNVRAGDLARAIDMLMPVRDAELVQDTQIELAAHILDKEAFSQKGDSADDPHWKDRRADAYEKAKKILSLPFDLPEYPEDEG